MWPWSSWRLWQALWQARRSSRSLVKPFNLTVLLARLRAHLRRRPDAATDTEPIRVADLVADTAARRCLLGDREIELRPKEFELLVALARRPGVALTREDLMVLVWDDNGFGSTKTLDVTMAALRRRLSEAVPPPTEHGGLELPKITTLRGHGYRLELPRQHELKAPCRRGAPQLLGDLVVGEAGGPEFDGPGASGCHQSTVAVFDHGRDEVLGELEAGGPAIDRQLAVLAPGAS
jgi:DNA-binding winged helix-turn-helix (wHTH) protein